MTESGNEGAERLEHEKEEQVLHDEHEREEADAHLAHVREERVLHEEHEREEREHERHHDDIIKVTVFAPRHPEPKVFEWNKALLVGQASLEAATAFGYTAGHPGLQTETTPPRNLDPTKTLEQEHVTGCEKLELTDIGGGV